MTEKEERTAAFARIILQFFMVVVYSGAGFMVLKFREIIPSLSPTFRVVTGSLLMLYGFFRFIRLYKEHFQKPPYVPDANEE